MSATTPRPPLPGPDDGGSPGEDEGCQNCSITTHASQIRATRFGNLVRCDDCGEAVDVREPLAPLGNRHVGGLSDVPQEPFVFDENANRAVCMNCGGMGAVADYTTGETDACRICDGRGTVRLDIIAATITSAGAKAQPDQPKLEITPVMVNRAVECLRTKYPGIYQTIKKDDPSRSVAVVVGDLLRAGVG